MPTMQPETNSSRPPSAAWAVLLLALASCGDDPVPPAVPGNVLVLTLDTTRKDALGCYGHDPSPTPCLDRLAAESVVFDEAHTVVPLTLPAHASMFTGLYPVSTGVRVNGITRVPSEALTLAEILQEEGYSTGAAVAAYVLDPIFGLEQGFQNYDAPARTPGHSNLYTTQRPADEMVDIALAMMREMPQPFFFWLHLYDPHFPYEPVRRPRIPEGTSPQEVERILYHAEIADMDGILDGFFEQLRLHGLEQDLTLVVASDHGESLGEHGEVTHGHFVYDATMRVPLFVRHPGLPPGRVGTSVSLVDVTPTLLGLLGISRPDVGFDGLDLTPWLGPDPPPDPDRNLSLESYHLYVNNGWAPFEGLVRGPIKYVRSGRHELYDRGQDPGELDNLYAPEEARSRSLERQSEAFYTNPPHRLQVDASRPRFDPEAMAALGYAEVPAHADVERPDFDSLPDSLSHVDRIERFEQANLAIASNKPQRAIRILRLLCEEDPTNPSFHGMLGSQLLTHMPGALDEAADHLQKAIKLQFSITSAHYNLGLVWSRRAGAADLEARQLEQSGQTGDALAALRNIAVEHRAKALGEFLVALNLESNHPEALANVAVIYRTQASEALEAGDEFTALDLRGRSLEYLSRFLDEVPESHPDWARWKQTHTSWKQEQ